LLTWPEIWRAPNLETWRAAYSQCENVCATPFMHPEIVRSWLDSHGQERFDPFFFRAEHPDGRFAFHLLVRAQVSWSRGAARILMSAGGDSFDYSDPVVSSCGEAAPELDSGFWRELEQDLMPRQGDWFDLVILPRVRSRFFPSMPAGQEAEVAPYLALDPYDTIDDYFASRNRKLKREIERTEKKLAAMGKVAFTIYGPGMSDQVFAWLPNFLEEKARRYPSSASSDLTEAYFRNLVTTGLDAGVLSCSAIDLDGRSLSWFVNFRLGDSLHYYSSAFDSEFGNLSLGSLHHFRTIEWGLERGLRVYDFMWGAEAYKKNWTDGAENHLHRVTFRSTRPASVLRRALGVATKKLYRARAKRMTGAAPTR